MAVVCAGCGCGADDAGAASAGVAAADNGAVVVSGASWSDPLRLLAPGGSPVGDGTSRGGS